MEITLGTRSMWALVFTPTRPTPIAGESAEMATLADIAIWAKDQNLTHGEDDEGTFEDLQVPLVDLAHWLAQEWDSLVYETRSPLLVSYTETPLQPTLGSKTLAGAWRVASRCLGDMERSDEVFDWASRHALEFAATDYTFPNVVFQRAKNHIDVSWAPRPTPAPQSEVRYLADEDSVLLPWVDFRDWGVALMQWVVERCGGIENDARVKTIQTTLGFVAEVP